MNEEYARITGENIAALRERMQQENPGMEIEIEPFFGGNQFFAFVMEVYTDVRLVGTPPSSIGKFGGDTDNWMWPRHTGDFSIFRVYAGPGQPAGGLFARKPPLQGREIPARSRSAATTAATSPW